MSALGFTIAALAAQTPSSPDEARLLRFPSVGGEKIVFTYAGDLYSVPVNGGEANKLTSDVGYEMFSRISPDGSTVAFTAQYDGNTEVYTIPINGGTPKRVSYTATSGRDQVGERMGPNNIILCWTPDSKEIVFKSKWNDAGLRGILLQVPKEGGMHKQIPTSEGSFCSYSPNGKYLAMNRMFREFRTWKHYRGGQADDIWIHKMGTTEIENVTNNPAQDIFPMWAGEEVYFMSDRDSIMNLFCYNTKSKDIKKVTNFDNYDCKFPSHSQDYIVFENGGYIYKYDIKNDKTEKVEITLANEGVFARAKYSSKFGNGLDISPDGKRVIATVRGDLISLPADQGAIYNLTKSSGAHDRDPAYSPDGKYIAYFSDQSGEYQVHIVDQENNHTQLTNFTSGYPSSLSWSPDSKKLFFTNEKKEFLRLDVESKALEVMFRGDYGGLYGYDLSKDGNWATFTTPNKAGVSIVQLFDLKTKKAYPVTTPWYDSSSPIFSDDGKYLFFTSGRKFNQRYNAVEWNVAYDIDSYVFVIPLSKDTPNPTLLATDEQATVENEGKKDDMIVDLDGIVERASELPVGTANWFSLMTYKNDCLYFRANGQTKKISLKDLSVSPVTKSSILAYNSNFKSAIIAKGDNIYVVPTTSFKENKAIPTEDAKVYVDYSKEWKQIYDETWRIYRDHFYVENMHGKDWQGIHDKYAQMLPYVSHRHDLTYLIGEMIGELNVGHSYVTTGEAPRADVIKTGLLGAKFSKHKSGYFKVDHIYKGVSWSKQNRSPFGEVGIGVEEGDYVIAINNTDLKDIPNIYQTLIGQVGIVTSIKVNSKASAEGAKTIFVKPIDDETSLYYYEWVQNNIEKVNKASNGQLGYIHIPDMGPAGMEAFTKLFYTQLDKKGLIIDDRMNGGGNVSPIILERLQREAYRINMYRNGSIEPSPVPAQTFIGPLVCLVDKYSSSDGDLFPYSFQKLGLGPIIGTRTWGGIVGISGSKPYLDGQDVRTPFFTSYTTEGEWMIENQGVTPDIYVDINPFKDYLGEDAQLNKAIEVLLEKVKNEYKPLAPVPANPTR